MLAVKQPNFAVVALDFLVDMFNDDIQEVRLKAIDSLCKMSNHIEFREDQLEIILGLLEASIHAPKLRMRNFSKLIFLDVHSSCAGFVDGRSRRTSTNFNILQFRDERLFTNVCDQLAGQFKKVSSSRLTVGNRFDKELCCIFSSSYVCML
jgi:hypothetical protein